MKVFMEPCAAAAADHSLSSTLGPCVRFRQCVERSFIHYCQASSANTWRIEATDQTTVTISGSFPLPEDPRDDAGEEDKGDDGLTSSPSAPSDDINEQEERDVTEVMRSVHLFGRREECVGDKQANNREGEEQSQVFSPPLCVCGQRNGIRTKFEDDRLT